MMSFTEDYSIAEQDKSIIGINDFVKLYTEWKGQTKFKDPEFLPQFSSIYEEEGSPGYKVPDSANSFF